MEELPRIRPLPAVEVADKRYLQLNGGGLENGVIQLIWSRWR